MCLKGKGDPTAQGTRKTKLVMTAGESGVGGGCSPKPLRSQEALLSWLWMGPSRHFCQRVSEKQELKHHCTCLPWPSSPPSQCSRPQCPQHLGCHVFLTPQLLFLEDSRVHHALF